jgi:hypothetical protein
VNLEPIIVIFPLIADFVKLNNAAFQNPAAAVYAFLLAEIQ